MRTELLDGVAPHARDAEVLQVVQECACHDQANLPGHEMVLGIVGPDGWVSRLVFTRGMGEYMRTAMALEAARFRNTGLALKAGEHLVDDTFE